MKHPAYHLRPNKAIDRFMLIEILKCFDGITTFEYIGFGGPFLEDFRLLHQYFPAISLICIEKNQATYKRQHFHKVTKNMSLLQMPYQNFLSQHDFRKKSCVWLDYTTFDKNCLSEFCDTIQRVQEGSIVKITVRSDTDEDIIPQYTESILSLISTCIKENFSFDEKTQDELIETLNNIIKKEENSQSFQKLFLAEFAEYLPDNYEQYLKNSNQQKLLIKLIFKQAVISSCAGDMFFLPVNCTYYNDQTEMMSLTGVVINRSQTEQIKHLLSKFKFLDTAWDSYPQKIDIPMLSIKERLKLEKYLPLKKTTGRILHKALGYNVMNKEKQSLEILKLYNDFYKYYPVIGKLSL